MRLLRVSEVAGELGCSERFLGEADKRGKIPKAKRDINNWRVYTEEDIIYLERLLLPHR